MFWIILWILLFMFLVLIHELGHFFAAKKSWVKVLEFGIWIPPKVCKIWTDKSGTEYTLNLLPLGGFVRLKWEDQNNKEEFYAKDSLITAKLRKRIIIVCAWVFMNFVFAWLIFSAIFWKWTYPIWIIPSDKHVTNNQSYLIPSVEFIKEKNLIKWWINSIKTSVAFVWTWTSAEKIWLEIWDIIVKINGKEINWLEFGTNFFKDNSLCWTEVSLDILRWKKILNKKIKLDSEWCKLGIVPVSSLDPKEDFQLIKFGLKDSLWYGAKEIYYQTKTTLVLLGQLWEKLFSFDKAQVKEATNSLSSPVWITKIIKELVELWERTRFLALFGMISLALAIFNILPIPALDGGRLLGFLIQEWFRLKKEKYFNIEWYINLVFFVLLMWFWVFIMLKDLVKYRWVNVPFMG